MLIAERQLFDDSIECLGLHDNCEETPDVFKDDGPVLPRPDDSVPLEELYDPPDPFGDLENIFT